MHYRAKKLVRNWVLYCSYMKFAFCIISLFLKLGLVGPYIGLKIR
jgi:hypothetical protein